MNKKVQVQSKLSSLSPSLSSCLIENWERQACSKGTKTNKPYCVSNQLTSASPPIDLTVYFVWPLESCCFFFFRCFICLLEICHVLCSRCASYPTHCSTLGDSHKCVVTLELSLNYFSYLKESRRNLCALVNSILCFQLEMIDDWDWRYRWIIRVCTSCT